ncbi:MAG: hypothetical protein KKH68_00650 [Proteobacteria bacterium]|nr:hypothetical protein [Pseudomonadota bacterium]
MMIKTPTKAIKPMMISNLSGAVTDLENRHSMRLKDFFDLFYEISFYIFEGLVFILIQGNGQYLLDV